MHCFLSERLRRQSSTQIKEIQKSGFDFRAGIFAPISKKFSLGKTKNSLASSSEEFDPLFDLNFPNHFFFRILAGNPKSASFQNKPETPTSEIINLQNFDDYCGGGIPFLEIRH